MIVRIALGLSAAVLIASPGASNASIVEVLTKDIAAFEGNARFDYVQIVVDGRETRIPLSRILSIHSGDPASTKEQAGIAADLIAIAGTDVKARDSAVAELTDIGLPVMTSLLQSFKDRDLRQPDPAYRLFARIIPGYADGLDRTLDLIRLKDGEAIRGKLAGSSLRLAGTEGQERDIPIGQVRRLAVRQKEVRRKMEIHSLLHSTQIEFADSGIVLTRDSKLESEAIGHVRLDFNSDGWSSDPDGLKKPGPNYRTNLVDGFPFGALVGRIGSSGPRWFMGRRCHKTGLESGRLFLAVNDNPHWQNNIGSFRATLRVTNAYDLGDPQ